MLLSRLGVALGIILFCTSHPAKAGFRCSAKGGPEWREYRTKHFLVDTDLRRQPAEVLIRSLEKLHALELQALVGEQVEIPGRLRVIAFSSPSQFEEMLTIRNVAGYFKVSSMAEPLIVLPVAGFQADPETVAHELAHFLSRYFFPRQPTWFAEGLAQFVETVASLPQDNAPATGSHLVRGAHTWPGSVGIMPRSRAFWLANTEQIPAEKLLAWNGGHDSSGSHHLSSWLLYHWLWNNRSKGLTDLQQRLSNGDDPTDAWRAAFPEFDPRSHDALAKLDHYLTDYRKSARYVFYQVKAEGDSSFTDAPIPSADVHLLLIDAHLNWPKDSTTQLRAELDEALEEDPAQPSAIAMRSQLEALSPLASLRKAVASRPTDWRGWWLLGHTLTEGEKDEKEAALRKAVQLNADSAVAHNELAWYLATHGRAKEALPIVNRALDLAPWEPNIIDTLATVAAELGKCPEALVLQRRAVGMLPPNDSNEQKFRDRLAAFERRCSAPAAPAGTIVAPGQSRR
jgi:tetratricopeptide (TPR) repeat protein